MKLRALRSLPIELRLDWTSDAKELEDAFASGTTYFALHEDKVILVMNMRGFKSASSFLHGIFDFISIDR